MKKIFYCLFIIAVPTLAQTPSVQWEKSVNGNLSGYDVVQTSWKDPSGNFLICGTSSNDAFVLKVDPNGNELQRVVYDGPQSSFDYGYAVKGDAAGNIYLGGITYYNSKNIPFVVKYSANGTKLWEYLQSNVTVDGKLTALAIDNYTSPSNVYFTGSKNDSSAITRINAGTGTSLWEKTLWPHGKMNDIDIDNNGHPLVCGYQAFSGNNADFYAAVLDIPTGYPLRGVWTDGAAIDSVTDPSNHYDMATKIKAGPAGSFVVLGTLYNSANAATIYMARFGSTGNVPVWTYSYNSPNHTEGQALQLLADGSFSNFYYLAGANSTGGTYYSYTIAGKVNNSGTAAWEQEFYIGSTNLDPHDIALDANGNIHLISDSGYPGDIYYKKLAASTGNVVSQLQYDNMRNGGNAYDYSSNIFLDNTGHPYIIGHSNALTYTNLDVLLVRLNTNSTLDWDLVFDFFINSQDNSFNLQVNSNNGGDQIVSCGIVLNNITSNDVAVTAYNQNGSVNWQTIFDDNNGADFVVGFEKSYSNNLFLCSYNNNSSQISVTEFYTDGTTNFSNYMGWGFQPNCFKLDSAENGYAVGSNFNYSDFKLGIFQRNGPPITSSPTALSAWGTTGNSIATDNNFVYVAGSIYDYSGSNMGQHAYVQKFDLLGNLVWSVKIMGFDSAAYNAAAKKIVYDRTTNAVYVMGAATYPGSTITALQLARINANGTVAWVRGENVGNTRNEVMRDMQVHNGNVYVAGFAYLNSSNDNMALVESWDVNGNKQWEYVFDKPGIIDEAQSLALDNNGNIFVGGKTNAPIFYSGSDMLLLKLNQAGTLLWEQEYNGDGNGDDFCTYVGLSNNFSNNPRVYLSGNVQPSHGQYYDIGTLKYCDLPVAAISYSGPTSVCQNTTIALAASGVGNGTIAWNNGQNGFTDVVNTTGQYFFTYSESDGCSLNSDTITITTKGAPAPVQICMVTVDDSSKHNLILWDKTSATPDVIGFNIYREDLTNIYHMVGSVPVSSLSEFVDLDPTANPNANTKRYKLTCVDSCGNESQMSNYHNTIYIVSNGNGQFSWNQLYTIENTANPVVQYILLRDDYNNNNWHAVDSTAGTQFNINDVNFSTFQPTANWRVVTQWNIVCTPTQRLANGNTIQSTVVKSKSNITNNRVVGVGSLSDAAVNVYPNPAQNTLTVRVTTANTNIKITSVLGEEVYAGRMSGTVQQIDVSKLAPGVYMLQLSNEGGKFIKQFVKE